MSLGKATTVLAFAFVGWALCGATMGIGQATTTIENALIAHAVAAPIIFAATSYVYFTRYAFTTPAQTALVFLGFVMAMDFFLVALVINRSLEMFGSLLGTWIPFALLSSTTYITGRLVQRDRRPAEGTNVPSVA